MPIRTDNLDNYANYLLEHAKSKDKRRYHQITYPPQIYIHYSFRLYSPYLLTDGIRNHNKMLNHPLITVL